MRNSNAGSAAVSGIRTKRYLLFLLGIFVLTRCIYFSAGIRFDIAPLLWFWQLIDPVLLKNHLIQSIYYQHTQPPLFNSIIGLILKIATNYENIAFHILYLAWGMILVLFLFLTMVRLQVSPKIAAILSAFFLISPASILYENWLLYTYLMATLLVVAAYFLHYFFSTRSLRVGFIFFSLLGLCVCTRTVFHLLWLLSMLLLLVNSGKQFYKSILLCAALPIVLVSTIFVKNWVVWGEFSHSTWLGMSLFKVVRYGMTQDELNDLVRRNRLSEASLCHPYSWLSSYTVGLRNVPQTEVPVLDQKLRSTGFNNYNNLAYQRISKYYLSDSFYLIAHHPGSYLKGLREAFLIYFRSPTDSPFLRMNRDRILGYNRAFDRIVYGKFGPDGQIGWFSLAGIPLLLLFSIRQIGKAERNHDPATKVTLLFITLNVLYVTFVGNALEVGDNNRYRFETEPFFYVLFGIFVDNLIKRFRRAG